MSTPPAVIALALKQCSRIAPAYTEVWRRLRRVQRDSVSITISLKRFELACLEAGLADGKEGIVLLMQLKRGLEMAALRKASA